jgi:N-formylglutamate amidohydrolase
MGSGLPSAFSNVFTLTEPDAARETPVVVEVPHAGLHVPAAFLATLTAPVRALGRDADLHVDALYADAPDVGATLLVAHTSRYVIDLNRSEADVDAASVDGIATLPRLSHGLIWRLTTEGERALARPLTPSELEERLETIHRPYHAALSAALARKKERFGYAVLLAAHSMPSFARTASGGSSRARADVVPGTRGRTSAAAPFIDAVERHATAAGLSVRHDDPYRGGFSTQHYGRPEGDVHAVQVELARRLYMDELTLRPRPGAFEAMRTFCRALVETLGAVDPGAGAAELQGST